MKASILLTKVLLLLAMSGCASYEKFRQVTEELEMPSKIYKADFNQTWQSVIQVMKKFDIAQQNQESGTIKTRWMDNTMEVNFTDSFGSSDAVKAAKFKLIINVVKGYRASSEVAKVTIYKRQLVEQDFLQGWKEITTDGIMEQTLLYRIGRLIETDNKLKEIDKAREKQQLQNF
ncbi:MAG: outer membrane protein assembly factor BamC [Bacteriovoracaceae bacterium]|nr:outer membrane protein assembly factor BamC [Bacteriovoracaceae bacterium]